MAAALLTVGADGMGLQPPAEGIVPPARPCHQRADEVGAGRSLPLEHSLCLHQH